MKKLLFILFSALLLWPTAVVMAHADLQEATPAPGANLAQSPAEIRLVFNEPVGEGSGMTLLAADFTAVSLPTAVPADAPNTLLADNVPQLAAGVYTVQWQILSEDGHSQTGSYQFAIGDTMLASMPLAEAANSFNPPGAVGWFMLILALALPLALRYWVKNQ